VIRSRRVEAVVGLFTVFGVVLLVAIFFLMLGKEHAFEGRFRLIAIFDNVSGLKPGAAVQLAGIDVGSVGSVRFNEENQAEVVLEIRNRFSKRLHRDAEASIATMGLLGDKIILLTSGTLAAGPVMDGTVISTQRYVEIAEIVDEVGPALQNMKDILDNMSEFLASLNAPVSELQKVLSSASQIAERLEAGEGTVGAILKDRQLYAKLVEFIDEANVTVRQLQDVAADVEEATKDLPEASAAARRMMANLEQGSTKLSELLVSGKEVVDNAKAASKDFPALVDRTNRIAENLETITDNAKAASSGLPDLVATGHEGLEQGLEVVEAARRSWLVRGYLESETEHVSSTSTLRDTNYSEGK
jgi:phospholipid/cholesterol/gamma-HCH transport system substrate-binding protein